VKKYVCWLNYSNIVSTVKNKPHINHSSYIKYRHKTADFKIILAWRPWDELTSKANAREGFGVTWKTKSLLKFYALQKQKFSCILYVDSQFLCALARFILASRGVRPTVQSHTYARLLVFDETLAQPDVAVVFCSYIVMNVFYSPDLTRNLIFLQWWTTVS